MFIRVDSNFYQSKLNEFQLKVTELESSYKKGKNQEAYRKSWEETHDIGISILKDLQADRSIAQKYLNADETTINGVDLFLWQWELMKYIPELGKYDQRMHAIEPI